MPDPAAVHPDVLAALGDLLGALDEFAPGVVEGLYVVGSVALGDWHAAHSDVDVIGVTAEPATDEDAAGLRAAHAALAGRRPRPVVDGPYVAWGDLVVAPGTGLHRPWILDGAFHHDGDCVEINPITWYVLAARGLAARGPSAASLEIAVDADDRMRFARDDLASYWRPLGEQIAAAPDGRSFTTADLEWCALGPLRMHHTALTAGVTSKQGAGEHGLAVTPNRFHHAIRVALETRRTGADGLASAADMAATAGLVEWVLADVDAAR